MLKIVTVKVTLFEQNCRILFCDKTRKAVVVDPGGGIDLILAELKKIGAVCEQIWLTHSHLDHCGGVRRLKAETGARLYGHPSETMFRAGVLEACRIFDIPPGDMENCPEPDERLQGGEMLKFGEQEFKVLHTPGHSEGSLCFYGAAEGIVLVGDVLFAGSIGRTDLPGGNYRILRDSIFELMKSLPLQTRVLSGHGPDTSLEREKRVNPFLKQEGDSGGGTE